jgi:hypothetical protein
VDADLVTALPPAAAGDGGLAVLVPYRDRAAHLRELVPALDKLLRVSPPPSPPPTPPPLSPGERPAHGSSPAPGCYQYSLLGGGRVLRCVAAGAAREGQVRVTCLPLMV